MKKLLLIAIALIGLSGCTSIHLPSQTKYDEFKGNWTHNSSQKQWSNKSELTAFSWDGKDNFASYISFEIYSSVEQFDADYALTKDGKRYHAVTTNYDFECGAGVCMWESWGAIKITLDELKEIMKEKDRIQFRVYGSGVPEDVYIWRSQIDELEKEIRKNPSVKI